MRHDSYSVRIRTWTIKTLHPTMTTKRVLGYMCVERVHCQLFLTIQKLEMFIGHYKSDILFLDTYAAITFEAVEDDRSFHLITDLSTMATSFMHN